MSMGTKDTRPAVMADSSSPSGPALALASSPPASPGCLRQFGLRDVPSGALLPDRGGCARWLVWDWRGRDVGGDRGQLRVGLRRERLAHSYLELILGQPLLRERGLEHFNRLLAVGIRRPQVAAALLLHHDSGKVRS
jgi:hypothetical protein